MIHVFLPILITTIGWLGWIQYSTGNITAAYFDKVATLAFGMFFIIYMVVLRWRRIDAKFDAK
jgi:hypothetical protein